MAKTHCFCLAREVGDDYYLEIVNIKDPANPIHEGVVFIVNGPNALNDLCVLGNHCYIVGGNSLYVVDVSDRANPILVYTMNNGDSGVDLTNVDAIECYGNHLYINGSLDQQDDGFLQILGVDTPTAPTVNARMSYSIAPSDYVGTTSDLRIKYYPDLDSLYLFVGAGVLDGAWNSQVISVDVTDPNNPIFEWQSAFNNGLTANIGIGGNYLYAMYGLGNWHRCFDITDPTVVTVDSTFAGVPTSDGQSIAANDNYAFICRDTLVAANASVWSIHYPHPGVPVHVDTITHGDEGGLVELLSANSIRLDGNIAYVAAETSDCLQIIDITDPTAMTHEGRINDGDDGARLNGVFRLYLGEFAQTADFKGEPIVGIAPLGVQFTDLSTGLPALSSWTWNFGDGNTSAEQNPAHIYENPGKYTVTLTVD